MRDDWNHNSAYYPELIAAVTDNKSRVLDIGCGDGLLLQKLAMVSGHVNGMDRDAEAVSRAQARLVGLAHARVITGDVMDSSELAGQRFDVITCVAALHHIPLEPALERLSGLLDPGGKWTYPGLVDTGLVVDGHAARVRWRCCCSYCSGLVIARAVCRRRRL